MSERICCICKSLIESDNPAVLTVSSFGNPRYLCDCCDADFSKALSAKEYSEIKDAVSLIGEKMEQSSVDDELVIEEVGVILERATERAEAILDGSYDFSLDEDEVEEEAEKQDGVEVVSVEDEEPEETEEERIAREKKEKILKIIDTVATWALGIATVATVGYMIYKLIF